MKFLTPSNASTWIAVDRTRCLSVASVFHHVQPINHLAPLVPVYLAQARQSFLNVLIDLQIKPVDDNFAVEAIHRLPMPASRQQATEKEIDHRPWSFGVSP